MLNRGIKKCKAQLGRREVKAVWNDMENCDIQDQQLTKRQMERAHLHFTDGTDLGQQVTLLLKDSCSVLYVHGSAFPGNLNACGTAGIVGACEFHSDRKKVGSTDLIVTAARSGIADIEL